MVGLPGVGGLGHAISFTAGSGEEIGQAQSVMPQVQLTATFLKPVPLYLMGFGCGCSVPGHVHPCLHFSSPVPSA